MNKGDSLTLWHCGKAMNDFRIITNSNRMVQHKKNVYHESKRNEDGTLIIKSVDHYQSPSRWSAEDSMEDHKKMLDYINISTQDKSKCYVAVTHHAPTPLSIGSQYKNDYLMNGAFHSDLSEFIMDRPQIKLWTHGHMHDPSDYMMGETRVVCNPRGYHGYEQRAKEFKLKYLEI
jgi:Icc-related predicted phosphoesterase